VRTFLGGERREKQNPLNCRAVEQLNGRFGNLISKDNKAQRF
jgi:hypothetical protein